MGGMAGEDAEDEGSDALICTDCDGCVEDAGREEEGICDFVGDEGEVSISESETILGALELVFAPAEELLVILSRSLDANLLVVVDPDALLALTIEFREEEVAICDCCSISSLTMGNGHSTRSTLSSLSSRLTRTFHSASSHLHFAVLFTTRFFPFVPFPLPPLFGSSITEIVSSGKEKEAGGAIGSREVVDHEGRSDGSRAAVQSRPIHQRWFS